jgi:predicted nucleotidyltransferase
MQPIIELNRERIVELCIEHHIKNLYAFGSVVNGEFTMESDVDLLYEMDYTGFDLENMDGPYDPFIVYFDLKEKLENLFGKRVDLIPNQNFRNKYFRESVEKTKTPIYVSA